jgi:hypothetical protein
MHLSADYEGPISSTSRTTAFDGQTIHQTTSAVPQKVVDQSLLGALLLCGLQALGLAPFRGDPPAPCVSVHCVGRVETCRLFDPLYNHRNLTLWDISLR